MERGGGSVANFRARIGSGRDGPEVTELIGELSLYSQDFRGLWARHASAPPRRARRAFGTRSWV
ncbi:hypothetical protein AB0D74_49225 [Streptomyces sp. NPDC048278]|uniref:MmyB family transcriptional regulator n=1 Tax=unclassified Streptomyces TaxID=2593676 RepID=UPI00342E0016